MKFFIDNNLPEALANSLNVLTTSRGDPEVIHLRQIFAPSTPDHIWISQLASEGQWVIVTHDRLAKNNLEKTALRQSGLTAFFLLKAWAHQKFWDKSYQLVRWWPRIIQQSSSVQAGASFEVPWKFSGNGKFRQFNF
jgi:hypothetical protein